ncbi:small acid-soluble spore protein K [Acinetobacter bohemicus]
MQKNSEKVKFNGQPKPTSRYASTNADGLINIGHLKTYKNL